MTIESELFKDILILVLLTLGILAGSFCLDYLQMNHPYLFHKAPKTTNGVNGPSAGSSVVQSACENQAPPDQNPGYPCNRTAGIPPAGRELNRS